MPNMVVQTQGLTKVFKDFWNRPRVRAVDDLDLDVPQGSVFGLLGPNGSGKSTTINLILGLLFPTRGQISVFGRPPTDVATKRRVGFLPEESYLYRYLDAEETLDFYGRLFGLPAAERRHRVESLLRMTGLLEARKRLLGEYSKGMARRIGIAQALINDPQLVILDEPTTGLDPIGSREIKDLILQLKEKGKTVLLSSHLLADVEDVCDDVCVLYGGRKRAEGPTQELLRRERLTQITGPMDPRTIDDVVRLIRERIGEDTSVQVGPPSERLEHFFLRVVEEARRSRAETSGVTEGAPTLDFLTAAQEQEPGASVLERLTAQPAPQAEHIAEPAPAGPTSSDEERVIAELTRPGGRDQKPSEQEGPTHEEPEEHAEPQVLERLTRGDHEEPHS